MMGINSESVRAEFKLDLPQKIVSCRGGMHEGISMVKHSLDKALQLHGFTIKHKYILLQYMYYG